MDATLDGSILPIGGADSVRVIRHATATVEIDAYGTVKTPFNSYESLRQKTETTNIDSAFVLFLGNWALLLADSSQSIQYQWLTAETKGDAVNISVDPETGLIIDVEYFLDIENATAPLASFIFDDQGAGTIAFSDQSTNTPTAWEWTFGDGGTSNEQNPVYTYSVAGEYQVCLTASNAVGSNQSCQTIMVDLLNSSRETLLPIQLSVYPNPASEFVLISPEEILSSTLELRLFNPLGQHILRQQFNGQIKIDLNHLPNGIYHYSITTLDQKRRSIGKLRVAR